jgi:hypothetical protein
MNNTYVHAGRVEQFYLPTKICTIHHTVIFGVIQKTSLSTTSMRNDPTTSRIDSNTRKTLAPTHSSDLAIAVSLHFFPLWRNCLAPAHLLAGIICLYRYRSLLKTKSSIVVNMGIHVKRKIPYRASAGFVH